MCRDLFRSFFLILLALSIALTANIFVLRARAFDAFTYKSYLANSGFYPSLSAAIKNYVDKQAETQSETPQEQTQIDPSQIIMKAFIAEGLTEEKLQQISETLLDRSFGYIKGTSESLKFEDVFVLLIAAPEGNTNFYDQIESKVGQYLVDLDVCDGNAVGECVSSEELKDLKNLDIEKMISENPEFQKYLGEVGGGSNTPPTLPNQNEVANPFAPEQQKTEDIQAFILLRQVYRSSETIIFVGLAISLLFFLLVILLSNKTLPDMAKALGIIFMVGAFSTALLAGLLIFGLWSSSQTLILGSSVVPPDLIALIQKLISGLTFEIQKPLYIVSGIVFVAGLLITILGSALEEKTVEQKVQTGDIKVGNVPNRPEVTGIKAKLENKAEATPSVPASPPSDS